MNRLRFNLRNVWQHDFCPSADIDRSVKVSMGSESAHLTLKDRLRRPVGFLYMPAARTFSRGVTRVYEYDRDTRTSGFVLDVLAQLCECPRVQRSSLRPFRPDPRPNPFKLLEGNRSIRALSHFYDAFCNDVVCVARKTGLTTRTRAQLALSRACTFFLQLSPKAAVTVTNALNVATAHFFAVGSGRDVINAEVYAKHTLNVVRCRGFNFARTEQIKLAPHKSKVRLALLSLQKLPLTFTRCPSHVHAPLHRPDRHRSLSHFVAQDAAVVGDSAQGLKHALGFLVELVSVGNLSNTPNHDLSGQREGFLDMLIDKFLKPKLPKRASIPSHPRDVVARLIGANHRLFKRLSLFGRWQKLDLGNELHALILPQSFKYRQIGIPLRGSQFLPGLENRGILAAFL